jgi:hypothetical protein
VCRGARGPTSFRGARGMSASYNGIGVGVLKGPQRLAA